jgi:hypothetical protein
LHDPPATFWLCYQRSLILGIIGQTWIIWWRHHSNFSISFLSYSNLSFFPSIWLSPRIPDFTQRLDAFRGFDRAFRQTFFSATRVVSELIFLGINRAPDPTGLHRKVSKPAGWSFSIQIFPGPVRKPVEGWSEFRSVDDGQGRSWAMSRWPIKLTKIADMWALWIIMMNNNCRLQHCLVRNVPRLLSVGRYAWPIRLGR